MQRRPYPSSPVSFLALALVAGALLIPAPAGAQFWKKIKEAAADAVKEEIDEQVGEPDGQPGGNETPQPGEAVKCPVDDTQCLKKAIQAGHSVVLTSPGGKVLGTVPASGTPAPSGGAAAPAASAGTGTAVSAHAAAPPPVALGADLRMVPLAPADPPLILSDDGAHAAVIIGKGDGVAVMVDGREGPVFDSLQAAFKAPYPVVLSPTGGRYAYIGRRGDDCVLVVDGKQHEPRPLIGSGWHSACPRGEPAPHFSYDSSHVAWVESVAVGPNQARSRVVFDGVAGPLYNGFINLSGGMDAHRYILLRGDHAFAIGVKSTGEQELLVDAEVISSAGLSSINHLRITQDGEHYAYVMPAAAAGDSSKVVLDGETVAAHDGPVTALYLHPSGSLAWLGFTGDDSNSFLVAGGRKFTSAEVGGYFKHFTFSPNGERFAFLVRSIDKKSWTVWVDGEPGPRYDEIAVPKYEQDYSNLLISAPGRQPRKEIILYKLEKRLVQFSADSSRFGYIARQDLHHYLVVDGEASEPLTYVGNFYFSASGNGYVYHARTMAGQDTIFVHANGKRIEGAPNPRGATFLSPDGKRFAYTREKDIVIDGKAIAGGRAAVSSLRGLSLTPVQFSAFTFSPDGTRLACITHGSSGTRIMLDGKVQMTLPSGTTVVYPIFSPDGEHFAFAHDVDTEGSKRRWRVMIDGQSGPVFDALVPHRNAWTFIDDDTLRLLAVRDGMVQRVTIEL